MCRGEMFLCCVENLKYTKPTIRHSVIQSINDVSWMLGQFHLAVTWE